MHFGQKTRSLRFLKAEKLNGNDLNKTFHKSWSKIKNSSRYELYVEQIGHYMSTYGSGFQDEIYIPEEVLNIPNVKLNYKVINAYSADEMAQKCLSLLKSGIALKEDTVDMLIIVLMDELGYTFTGKENIRNKEAIVKLAEFYNVYPDDPVCLFQIHCIQGNRHHFVNQERCVDRTDQKQFVQSNTSF